MLTSFIQRPNQIFILKILPLLLCLFLSACDESSEFEKDSQPCEGEDCPDAVDQTGAQPDPNSEDGLAQEAPTPQNDQPPSQPPAYKPKENNSRKPTPKKPSPPAAEKPKKDPPPTVGQAPQKPPPPPQQQRAPAPQQPVLGGEVPAKRPPPPPQQQPAPQRRPDPSTTTTQNKGFGEKPTQPPETTQEPEPTPQEPATEPQPTPTVSNTSSACQEETNQSFSVQGPDGEQVFIQSAYTTEAYGSAILDTKKQPTAIGINGAILDGEMIKTGVSGGSIRQAGQKIDPHIALISWDLGSSLYQGELYVVHKKTKQSWPIARYQTTSSLIFAAPIGKLGGNALSRSISYLYGTNFKLDFSPYGACLARFVDATTGKLFTGGYLLTIVPQNLNLSI